MQNTITRNTAARLKLAAANASAALALDATPAAANTPTGYHLIIAIVFSGYRPSPAELAESIALAKKMRRTLHTMSGPEKHPNWPHGPDHPLVMLDDQMWWVAWREDLSPEARAVIRASGHRTPAPACGVPMPVPLKAAA